MFSTSPQIKSSSSLRACSSAIQAKAARIAGKHSMLILPLLLAAVACHPTKGFCEAPLKADAVADGVGVNIHLHFGDTVYGNFPLIQQLLVDLGVRHTR